MSNIEIIQSSFTSNGFCEEEALIKYLRFKRGFVACTEVSLYGCIADVLALDKRKEQIFEFEFKRSSCDLKRNEVKKTKYGTHKKHKRIYERFFDVKVETPKPHRFYFVIPRELYDKEKSYIEGLNQVGVIGYWTGKRGTHFWVAKPVRSLKNCKMKYAVAEKAMLLRLSSAYASLLGHRALAEKEKMSLFNGAKQ